MGLTIDPSPLTSGLGPAVTPGEYGRAAKSVPRAAGTGMIDTLSS